MRRWFYLLFLCLPMLSKAQQTTKDEIISNVLEQYAQSLDYVGDLTDLQKQLEEFYTSPLNINTATREQLSGLFLLSKKQIENLLAHRIENGNLISLLELQSIDEFEPDDIERLLPFITIGDEMRKPLWSELRSGKSNIILRTYRIAEQVRGYDTGLRSGYLGDPYHAYFKYTYWGGKSFRAGIVADKDEGEEFFKGNRKQGFDFYSAHLFYSGEKMIRKIAVGDYQYQSGQGLSLWTSFATGKYADATNIIKNPAGILPSSSANEFRFLRGAAISLSPFNNFTVNAFFSRKYFDANIKYTDSLNNPDGEFSSIYTSGYHRTATELKNYHTATETFGGAEALYKYRGFEGGILTSSGQYSSAIRPDSTLSYKAFSYAGNRFMNAAIHYRWLISNFYFFGETATDKNLNISTLNGVLMILAPGLQTGIMYRNFSPAFYSPYSNCISENRESTNEKGTYLSAMYHPLKSLTINAYYDIFSFPWLKSTVNSPSTGHDALLDVVYNPDKKTSIHLRVKNKTKQYNVPTSYGYTESPLQNTTITSYRAEISYALAPKIKFKSRLEMNNYTESETDKKAIGYLIFQDVKYSFEKLPLGLSFRYALFDIPSYEVRISTLEDELPFMYSIPTFYNQGMRYYMLIDYHINRHFSLNTKFAQTSYLNLATISSGNDFINANHKTDLRLQLNISF